MLCEPGHRVGVGLTFKDETEDAGVTHMLQLIAEGYPFEHNSWHGGVTASEVLQKNNEDSDIDSGVNQAGYRSEDRSPERVEGFTRNGRRCDRHVGTPPPAEDIMGGSDQRQAFMRELADAFEERARGISDAYIDTVRMCVEKGVLTI